MSTDNTTSKPATPRRTTPVQVLSGLFRTPTRLYTPTTVSRRNKRIRSRTSPFSTPSTPNTPLLPAVVLQTYSVSTDSIVLTALPSAPFCCHEDLLTMSRAQLEAVVHALNARLPRQLRIGPEGDFLQNDDEDCAGEDDGFSRMSEAEMRRRIEELVGIRPVVGKNRVSRLGLGLGTRTGVPPAPKPVRTRDATWRPYERTPWEMELDGKEDQSDDSNYMEDAHIGSSPLANRTTSGMRKYGLNNMLPRLAILQEENEGGESKEDDTEEDETRPSKRQRRVSPGSTKWDSEGGSQIVQGVRESRLIENMDLSGSPLLVGDDDTSSRSSFYHDERVATNLYCTAEIPEEGVQVPLRRRRSARIKEITLRRTSPVDMGKKTTSDARNSKSSILGSKTLSSRRSSGNTSALSGGTESEKDPGTLRTLTVRLPFTSPPPHQQPDSSVWSAPRVLRSHSQRLLDSAKTRTSLGRSQSERYLRASDMAFVTINRPRYRFSRRKSKVNKATTGDQASHPLISALPEQGACQPQQSVQILPEHSSVEREIEKEDNDLKVATKNSVIGNLHTVSSTLFGFLTPRPRAPSTSTEASTRGNCGDSPARTTVEQGATPIEITDLEVAHGAAERVWEALGRMAVDSV